MPSCNCNLNEFETDFEPLQFNFQRQKMYIHLLKYHRQRKRQIRSLLINLHILYFIKRANDFIGY